MCERNARPPQASTAHLRPTRHILLAGDTFSSSLHDKQNRLWVWPTPRAGRRTAATRGMDLTWRRQRAIGEGLWVSLLWATAGSSAFHRYHREGKLHPIINEVSTTTLFDEDDDDASRRARYTTTVPFSGAFQLPRPSQRAVPFIVVVAANEPPPLPRPGSRYILLLLQRPPSPLHLLFVLLFGRR